MQPDFPMHPRLGDMSEEGGHPCRNEMVPRHASTFNAKQESIAESACDSYGLRCGRRRRKSIWRRPSGQTPTDGACARVDRRGGEFAEHVASDANVLEEDEQAWARSYRYIRAGPDHYSPALTYAWLCTAPGFLDTSLWSRGPAARVV